MPLVVVDTLKLAFFINKLNSTCVVDHLNPAVSVDEREREREADVINSHGIDHGTSKQASRQTDNSCACHAMPRQPSQSDLNGANAALIEAT